MTAQKLKMQAWERILDWCVETDYVSRDGFGLYEMPAGNDELAQRFVDWVVEHLPEDLARDIVDGMAELEEVFS